MVAAYSYNPTNPYAYRSRWPLVVGAVALTGAVVGAVLYSRSASAATVLPTTPKTPGTTLPDVTPDATPGPSPSPTPGPTPPADVPRTVVVDPVTGEQYQVPMSEGFVRATRAELGLQPMPWSLHLGQRLAFIERWPQGAEMLWGHVKSVGPGRSYYDVEVAEKIPWQGAFYDVRPTQLAQHQTASGSTVRVMPEYVINAVV